MNNQELLKNCLDNNKTTRLHRPCSLTYEIDEALKKQLLSFKIVDVLHMADSDIFKLVDRGAVYLFTFKRGVQS